jgi:hypothetical protein
MEWLWSVGSFALKCSIEIKYNIFKLIESIYAAREVDLSLFSI